MSVLRELLTAFANPLVICLAAMAILFTVLAWGDLKPIVDYFWPKHRQSTTPQLSLEINNFIFGQQGNRTGIIFTATLNNNGAPSIAKNWKFKVTKPDGTVIPVRPQAFLEPQHLYTGKTSLLAGIDHDPGNYRTIYPEDALYQKASSVIPQFGMAAGYLIVVADLPMNEIMVKGTILEIECRDSLGEICIARRIVDTPNEEDFNIHHQGTKR